MSLEVFPISLITLSLALIIPYVTDCPMPSALPIATTLSPTSISSEFPILEILIFSKIFSSIFFLLTDTIAKSFDESTPLIEASTSSISLKATFKLFDAETTWLLVRIILDCHSFRQ
jgi:hypothetical protein